VATQTKNNLISMRFAIYSIECPNFTSFHRRTGRTKGSEIMCTDKFLACSLHFFYFKRRGIKVCIILLKYISFCSIQHKITIFLFDRIKSSMEGRWHKEYLIQL